MPFNLFSPATWFAKQPDLPQNIPTGLFQSRITHTPGGFGPLPQGLSGNYYGTVNPGDVAGLQTNITPQESAQLAQRWRSLGPGFITMPPGQIDPDTFRHEQWHDLYQKAGLAAHAGEIAPLVPLGTRSWLASEPKYQEEMRQSGRSNIMADEGTAYDQMNYHNFNPELQNKIMENLKSSLQKKQFQQLTARPNQSQK